jgi:hypothetical protein
MLPTIQSKQSTANSSCRELVCPGLFSLAVKLARAIGFSTRTQPALIVRIRGRKSQRSPEGCWAAWGVRGAGPVLHASARERDRGEGGRLKHKGLGTVHGHTSRFLFPPFKWDGSLAHRSQRTAGTWLLVGHSGSFQLGYKDSLTVGTTPS